MDKSTKNYTVVAVLVVLVVIAGWYFLAGIGYKNREATLRASFNNSLLANRVDYDTMWKTIAQVAEVPQQYSQDFKDAYTSIVSSSVNTDSNTARSLMTVAMGMRPPQLDSTLYRKVQNVIESERARFANAQKTSLAIKTEHDTLRSTWPGSLFVGGTPPLEMTVVTSTRTQQVFETGKDDDVKLYGDK